MRKKHVPFSLATKLGTGARASSQTPANVNTKMKYDKETVVNVRRDDLYRKKYTAGMHKKEVPSV